MGKVGQKGDCKMLPKEDWEHLSQVHFEIDPKFLDITNISIKKQRAL